MDAGPADAGIAGRVRIPKSEIDASDEFWIEVALALGGRSPEEWQEAITPEWRDKLFAYRHKNGPFNPSIRIEWAIARALAMFASREFKPADWMVWPKEPEKEASVQEVFGLFKSLATQKESK